MEIQRALELLKQSQNRIRHLKTLPPYSAKYVIWKNKVDVVLKNTFGTNSEEYRWVNPTPLTMRISKRTEAELQKEYLEDLEGCELGIAKILDKYEILGVDDTKPSAIVEPKRAAELIRQKLEKLKELFDKKVFLTSEGYHTYFREWCAETEYMLIHIFGEGSRELRRLANAQNMPPLKGTPDELNQYRRKAMERTAAELKAILASIEEYGIPKKQEGAVSPKAFIAHEGEIVSLNKASRRELLTDLELFHEKFVRYKQLVLMPEEERVAKNLEGELATLRLELERRYGRLKEVIEKHGSSTRVLLQGGKWEGEAFTSAFSYKLFDPKALEVVMDTAIAAVNTTIGKLQAIPFESKISKPHKFRRVLQWIKAHKVRSIIVTVLLILVTLLGTNWTTVKDNLMKFFELLH